MNCWRRYKTRQLIDEGILEIGDGYRAKNSEMGTAGLPFVRAGDVDGRVRTLGCDKLSEGSVRRAGNKISRAGDVVLTTKGTIGRLAFVDQHTDEFVYSPQLCFWRSLRPEKLAPRFLYYSLQSEDLRHQMSWSAAQTDMAPYVSLTDQRNAFEISVPDVDTQLDIANLLGSLDDKIELNRRMNETLEAMAQAIFRDWFVDFGPTRRKLEGATDPVTIMGGLVTDPTRAQELANLFPATLGDDGLPEGWRDRPFTSFIDIVGGGTPKTSVPDYWGGNIPWFSVVDTPPAGAVFALATEKSVTELGVQESSTRIVRAGTTIISARGTVGNLAVAPQPMTFNQSCYGLQGRDGVGDWFVFLASQHVVERLRGMAHGSVFSTITRQTFDGISLCYPSPKALAAFEAAVGVLFEKIKASGYESRTLAATRDLLLPKLMSGEIRLGEAEELVRAAQ